MSNKGRYYWFVEMASGDKIHLSADTCDIENGDLVFRTVNSIGGNQISFGVAAKKWDYAYAASGFDGGAVFFHQWIPASKKGK